MTCDFYCYRWQIFKANTYQLLRQLFGDVRCHRFDQAVLPLTGGLGTAVLFTARQLAIGLLKNGRLTIAPVQHALLAKHVDRLFVITQNLFQYRLIVFAETWCRAADAGRGVGIAKR